MTQRPAGRAADSLRRGPSPPPPAGYLAAGVALAIVVINLLLGYAVSRKRLDDASR